MDEQILIRFLTHQCSAAEVEQIEQWIALDKTNAERFFEIERIWSLKEELKFTEKKEVESAYNHFVSIIEKKETARKKKKRPLLRWCGYAAALVLFGLTLKTINLHLIRKNKFWPAG